MSYPTRKSPGQALSLLTGVCILAGVSVAAPASEHLTGEQASRLLGQIAAELEPLAAASRKVLLGTRKPGGPSCVRPVQAGDLRGRARRVLANPNGGPGTRLAAFFTLNRKGLSSVRKDLLWHQTALRDMFGRMLRESEVLSGRAESLSQEARGLAAGAAAWTRWPAGLGPADVPDSAHWPGVCLRRLRDAVAAKDLPACRRWAEELAAATFALADLHRWLEFLLANHVAALDYQAKCRDLFAWTQEANRAGATKHDPDEDADAFPGMAMILPTIENLLEVERQAERLFGAPKAFLAGAAKAPPAPHAAVWMPPDLRKDFVFLRSCLSSANRRLWDQAASMPFERSYLANMLFRVSCAKVIDRLGVALRRFDQLHPRAEVADLMDVLFYRGEVCGGVEWGDRFDSRLLRAAGHLAGDSQQVLRRAHRLANTVLGSWKNCAGNIWTLREALDQQKLDCVRGTDMIGSLYRNAGGAGYYCIRLSCGVAAHSVGAAETGRNGVRATLIADSLAAVSVREVWPSAYFRGFVWPKGYPGPRGPAFSAELYARGLDNYVFAEGYIVRGRHAGELVCAAIPYLPGRQKADVRIIYGGPYPPIPAVPRPAATSPGR